MSIQQFETSPGADTVSRKQKGTRIRRTAKSPNHDELDETEAPPYGGAAERATKHERVLTLLSHEDGASIEEIMTATNWQKHSVRGFLSGTVKKKLGFHITSSVKEGEPRRYRIDTGRQG
jgi:hypothetical protein